MRQLVAINASVYREKNFTGKSSIFELYHLLPVSAVVNPSQTSIKLQERNLSCLSGYCSHGLMIRKGSPYDRHRMNAPVKSISTHDHQDKGRPINQPKPQECPSAWVFPLEHQHLQPLFKATSSALYSVVFDNYSMIRIPFILFQATPQKPCLKVGPSRLHDCTYHVFCVNSAACHR